MELSLVNGIYTCACGFTCDLDEGMNLEFKVSKKNESRGPADPLAKFKKQKQEAKPMSKKGTCVECNRPDMTIVAAGKCWKCYDAARKGKKSGMGGGTGKQHKDKAVPVRTAKAGDAGAAFLAQLVAKRDELNETIASIERYTGLKAE